MAAREFLAQNNVYREINGNISFEKDSIEKSIENITNADYGVYSRRIQAFSSAILNIKPNFLDSKNRQKSFDEKSFAITGKTKKDSVGLIKLVHKLKQNDPDYWQFIKNQNKNYLEPFGFSCPHFNDILLLPYSLFLQFQFTLAKPFSSRDDELFYIIENPVKKDKVFKVPMMSGSGWKGNLRWTAGKNFVDSLSDDTVLDDIFTKRIQLIRIFGNENKAVREYFDKCIYKKLFNRKAKTKTEKQKEITEKIGKPFQAKLVEEIPAMKNVEGLQGRLYFYPTFFDKIDLEVINPHNRKTRAGKNPIYFEVVPVGATGIFTLLWFPFDLVGNPKACKQALKEDWKILKDAMENMFLIYGFSAKKSSGFGIIENNICKKSFAIAGTKTELKEEKGSFCDFLKSIDSKVEEISHV